MSFSSPSHRLKPSLSLAQFRLNQYKQIWHRKAHKMGVGLIVSALSFSTVGCNTLQALEPTAILISDIKNTIHR